MNIYRTAGPKPHEGMNALAAKALNILPASQLSSTRPAVTVILVISAAATLFLFWLIYVHPAADAASARLTFLPALNALLNGLSATALLIGFTFIRARKIAAHRASMITAFIFSTLFLVSYILHHALLSRAE